ncbi:Pleckstrin homology domain [Dillenia turbinata]|uniref:Pleckstrin homology domain n=1 Tax=Dillenia turbinata TaxID=194707 RepID=A0AAN8VNM8_9MAGN
METKLLESRQQLNTEVNKSWLGSLISTIIGNLKLSISNIHIRYEDLESNPGHPFAAGISLEKLSAMTVDDKGIESFVTGGSLEHIQKSVELGRLALYLDSDILPWCLDKPWEDLLPAEWVQIFKFGTENGKPAEGILRQHSYVLQPVSGSAKYSKKLRSKESSNSSQPLQKAVVNLDDVTLCLPKDGYRDILKLADNFTAFNQRLKNAHFRPSVSVRSDPRSWWKYAYKVVSEQLKKASGKLSWDQVLKYASLRKRYITLYASLLKSDPGHLVVDDSKEIEEFDRGLDIELILQWRMIAHKFVEQSKELEHLRKQKAKKSWWSFGWSYDSKDEGQPLHLTEEDWERLNKMIGYKDADDGQLLSNGRKDVLHTLLEVHMRHNASKLVAEPQQFIADLSCENFDCLIRLYAETKIFHVKLGSYRLSSPDGVLAKSATAYDSLVGVFSYKPFDTKVDWSLIAKASPSYVTYLKESIEQIVNFFEGSTSVSQTMAVEAAAAVQMTIDGMKRTAQEQVTRALKDRTRFLLDLDIAAPKVTIPTDFCPDNIRSTKLLLDLGNLIIRTEDDSVTVSAEEMDMYLGFDLMLRDVSAFLVDGDFQWGDSGSNKSFRVNSSKDCNFLPVVDKCGVILKFQQIRLEDPSYPSVRLALRLPSLGFHFSPARYHRLMQVARLFQDNSGSSVSLRPWTQADFEGWLSVLSRKGMGNREAIWQRRFLCLVGPLLYVLESPDSESYKQCVSLRGKVIYQVPTDLVGNVKHVLAVCDASRANNKVVEDLNALIILCDSDDLFKTWLGRLQGAIYLSSGSAPITLSESSSDAEDSEIDRIDNQNMVDLSKVEKLFMVGVLDELKICFNYNNPNSMTMLFGEENRLFEFRALGGRVELSYRAKNMFIGTILKSLEIEDLVCSKGMSQPCYLARSFMRSTDVSSSLHNAGSQSLDSIDDAQSESDDKFYEAAENLADLVDSPMRQPKRTLDFEESQSLFSYEKSSFAALSFSRLVGLLPDVTTEARPVDMRVIDTLDSFVRADIVIYDQNSSVYNNLDMQVTVTLAMLSFFFRRPTILAVMDFVNAINAREEGCESFSDNSSAVIMQHDSSREIDNQWSNLVEEPKVKGLLGKGKSRIIFFLILNMARAEISLMTENETKIATLSQNYLLTQIKVFPSSFEIKASLGNLRISNDSLHSSHIYFWACDMRDPGGSSFVELVFKSFSVDDEDYEGYEYSLVGQLSEVRIVYLNRFIQEVVSYFMGLVPSSSSSVIKLKDQVTNSEKWFTTNEIEGAPAVKLDISLKKPVILMPRRTDSLDYMKLDIVQISVQNSFQWFFGSKHELNAVRLETLTILVEDINLNVGIGSKLGDSIINNVKGVSVVIQRSLRDLLHQIPSTEVEIRVGELKAVLSNSEYQIISECAMSNISEAPNYVPSLSPDSVGWSENAALPLVPQESSSIISEMNNAETAESWVTTKVIVVVDLIELSLHSGVARDAPLASLQVSGTWLLYRSNNIGEGFLSATLKGFHVIDDREGTEEEMRLAIGKPDDIGNRSPSPMIVDEGHVHDMLDTTLMEDNNNKAVPTMLIFDANFSQMLTSVSLCIQRPQLLVALDFLLAVAEFFVPGLHNMLSTEVDERPLHMADAIILDEPYHTQTSSEFSLSPQKPLVVDDERFDHFVYDGKGGTLYIQDRQGLHLSSPCSEAIIYVGTGKSLQFRNITIKSGKYLDSCILLGSNSSYSISKDDQVYLEEGDESNCLQPSGEGINSRSSQNNAVDRPREFIMEVQAIGPELTFYNTSKDVGDSFVLSNKLLHAQLDAFCKLVMKGDTIEVNANTLGLTMESNGIRVLEPFDTSVKFSKAAGKTNIHIAVSDVFMNFSFSILRLFLAVEEDILEFLSLTSKKMTVVCTRFDKIGTIENPNNDQIYTFWRPHAPPGYAVFGDYLTPMDKPPTRGVISVNTSFARVKRPISFKLVWPPLASGDNSAAQGVNDNIHPENTIYTEGDSCCSIWFPEAPKGYVALGCVVSAGRAQPPLSSAFCISTRFVSTCDMRDCITINTDKQYSITPAFWRVDNSLGTFLPAVPAITGLLCRPYGLRHIIFGIPEIPPTVSMSQDTQASGSHDNAVQSTAVRSGLQFEAVASFHLVWWNQASGSRKRLSIWRPVVPQGRLYLGDIAVQGYEPPNMCIVLHDSGDGELLKPPLDFQLVGQIKKHKGVDSVSFWLPQAPPGFVTLGCIACRGTPKQYDFNSLRCIRSDMVTGIQFAEENLWDTSEVGRRAEQFSLWTVDNELGTFLVRSGYKKPPKRFALKLADPPISRGSDNTVIDAEIGTFSAALFDDYGGLIVPLFNASLSGIGFRWHGRPDYWNSSMSFSLHVRSYNDKYDSWEPLVEPVDGFLRYQYDVSTPTVASQLRFTSTRDLNLNVSVSNVNLIFQAYASWNSLSHAHETNKKQEPISPIHDVKSVVDVLHKRNYYVIPQNKLGQEIFIQVSQIRGLPNVIKMPSGDIKPLKFPVLKNMLDAHLKGELCGKTRAMVTIIIAEAKFPRVEGLSTPQYVVALRLTPDETLPTGSLSSQQSARTCGRTSSYSDIESELVQWSEIFFFKVDSLDNFVAEFVVVDMGKGDPVGCFSAPLKQIGRNILEGANPSDLFSELTWIELLPAKSLVVPQGDNHKMTYGKIKCAVFVQSRSDSGSMAESSAGSRKPGFIQISPSTDGPWSTVRFNYATPAACWRFGSDVVASEVRVEDGNRYVIIRSLVSLHNNTDFTLDLCLKHVPPGEYMRPLIDENKPRVAHIDRNRIETDEFFETERYDTSVGWVSCHIQPNQNFAESERPSQELSEIQLPSGWEWIDDWHIDKVSASTAEGWVYAPDPKSLKWPDSYNPLKYVNYARQRRWIRNRKQCSGDIIPQISIGLLNPGDSISLPLPGLTHRGSYVLQLRPANLGGSDEYSWSSAVNRPDHFEKSDRPRENNHIYVSSLTESEELLCCTQISGTSSNSPQSVWFSLSIKATEIAKDIQSNPIQDWCILVKSPLSITNYLPIDSEFSVLDMQPSGHFRTCTQGILLPGKVAKIYDADIQNPLYLSLLPQRGWLPMQEAVLISHPSGVPSKTISLRSSINGRIVQVILEQNHDSKWPLAAKLIRIYSPYWLSIARCQPLTIRFLDIAGRRKWNVASPFQSEKKGEKILAEISEEEIFEGCTVAPALNFKLSGISVSMAHSGKENFGPVKELSPLGDMDGSIDIDAYDADGNCMRLFISSKPCPHQSVPTKDIVIRPFMTFTNRVGEVIWIKLSEEDQPKILRATDARISFAYRNSGGNDKLQVRLEDTEWSFPVQNIKEGTFFLVLRRHDSTRRFLRTEIRGYEEGSRFVVVFRLGSTKGLMRIENRTSSKVIRIRQTGFGDYAWIHLEPLSTTNFCWEDPYGLKIIDAEVHGGGGIAVLTFNLETFGLCSTDDAGMLVNCFVAEMDGIKVVRFTDIKVSASSSNDENGCLTLSNFDRQNSSQNNGAPLEIIVELGIVGISVIDHKPKELLYLYLERVFVSYSTGYDGGKTSRFKLILGFLQLDNQLPLTVMPVLLAPDQTADPQHPVFKMTITISNDNTDGIQVYPYVYIRVSDKWWRLNIHEPIIWALVDFYNNMQFDRVPQDSSVSQVDPEIHVNLVDISEIRLKVSLEVEPAQRPHGVLGVWSPILSAVGNALKIQIHLRKVVHKDRFMRKSAIAPAIGNRIWRDLIHNPLHLVFSVDIVGMTSSTLASLSKGFAELSTDGQFLQLRSKQVWSRRITGVSDGIIQGTEAFAQGVAFGVSGVVRKPVESAREKGLLGLAHGLGQAALGFVVQPLSGALDFLSLTVDGIGASCARCLEVFNHKIDFDRIKNPRAIHADGILREYDEREACGQMILYLAEASLRLGCAEIFKEPSKFALSDYYEDHFIVPYQRIVLVTNKRVMLLQSQALDKLGEKPCKIMWDVPWGELLAVELAKAGHPRPSHIILHLKTFRRSEPFVQVIKCSAEEEYDRTESQAMRISALVLKMRRSYLADLKTIILKVPSSQQYVHFRWTDDEREPHSQHKAIVNSGRISLSASVSDERRFIKHSINFKRIWSSELEPKGRCILCRKKDLENGGPCSIWRAICPDGYISVGDIAHVGCHPPNVAAVYNNVEGLFALPVGYDLVWRNCPDDYKTPVTIWHPRAPEGYVSPGCVAVADFKEPEPHSVYCVAESLVEETEFEEQKVWMTPDSYPWACHIYQIRSEALHFIGLRQPKEESEWRPVRVLDELPSPFQQPEAP